MRKKSESGYVLVIVAVTLMFLLGFSALAVDMGAVLSARTQAQRAADAAALAGAVTFALNPTLTDQPGRASTHALKTATANKVMGDAITDAQVSVTVQMPDAANDVPAQVTVTITRTEATILGRIFDVTGVGDKVTAVAEADTSGSGARCVKPFFIPNTALSSKDPCTAAEAGEVIVSNNAISTFASSAISSGSNGMTVKPADPQQALAPGDFYEIDINKGGGGAYSSNISSCNTVQLQCHSLYDVLTGNKMGPTTQGIHDLIGQPPVDEYVAVGQYKNSATNDVSDTSRALAIAPIWDLVGATVPPYGAGGFCPPPVGTCTDADPNKNCRQFPSGSNVTVEVIGFAYVFIENVNGGNVTARLINVLPCADTGSVGMDTGTSVGGARLQLVRTSSGS